MEQFKRNAVGISLLIIFAVAIVAVAVVVAVDANKTEINNEYFIDESPLDYGDDNSFIYAQRFRMSVGGYLKSIYANIDLSNFADNMLNALAAARVPANKLDSVATAINNNSLNDIAGAANNGGITVDQLIKIMNQSSFSILGSFFNKFFNESSLTSEELALFIYHYMNLYGTAEYRRALAEVGKEQFVNFISYSTYFMSATEKMTEGGQLEKSATLSAALYQLGDALIGAAEGGVDNLETVLGLNWIFDSDRDNYNKINRYTVALKGNLGYFTVMLGYVLKEIDVTVIDAIKDAKGKGEAERIYSATVAVNAAQKGIEKFIGRFGEDFGVSSFDEIAAKIEVYMENLFGAIVEVADGDREAYDDYVKETASEFTDFIEGWKLISENEFNSEEISQSVGTESFEKLKAAGDNVIKIKQEADEATCGIFYMWTTYRLYEGLRRLQ